MIRDELYGLKLRILNRAKENRKKRKIRSREGYL